MQRRRPCLTTRSASITPLPSCEHVVHRKQANRIQLSHQGTLMKHRPLSRETMAPTADRSSYTSQKPNPWKSEMVHSSMQMKRSKKRHSRLSTLGLTTSSQSGESSDSPKKKTFTWHSIQNALSLKQASSDAPASAADALVSTISVVMRSPLL